MAILGIMVNPSTLYKQAGRVDNLYSDVLADMGHISVFMAYIRLLTSQD